MSQLKGSGVGEDIYDAAATYGRVKTMIAGIIASIIALGLIFWGVKLRNTKETYSASTTAVIVTPNCSTSSYVANGRLQTSISCILDISYNVNGTDYVTKLNTGGRTYAPGEQINIRYNPLLPADITINPTNKTAGTIIMVIGIIIILLSLLAWYITSKSKLGASFVAANDALSLLRRD